MNAVAAAVDKAANHGWIAPPDVQDFQHRIDDLSHSLATGKTDDIAHKIDDFEHHLDDLAQKGHMKAAAYKQIVHALEGFRSVVGA